MNPLSQEIKKTLVDDPFMEKCIICYSPRVEWHHVFTYAGKQIDEVWNIVPMCKKHHDNATPHKNNYLLEIREMAEMKALERMQIEDIAKYPKKEWTRLATYLNNKYAQD